MCVLQDFHMQAIALFKQHDLDDWTFKFDGAIRRAGSCNFTCKHISISKHMVLSESIPFEKKINILLHEIAHAIVGHEHGHDDVWRAKAIEIGCDGERCHTLAFAPPPRYILVCPCGMCVAKRIRLKPNVWNTRVCCKCNQKLTLRS